MENFSQYKLSDFYYKRYYEGGLHLYQIQLMYEHIGDRKYNDYRFFASLSGVDLDKELRKEKDQKSVLSEQQKKQDLPLFRDPDEYNEYSQEEREKITEDMKKQHRQWVSGK